MSEKRKKTVFSVEEKLSAIRRLDAGETAKKIANEMGVGTSTVSDWKKSREKLEKWCSNQASSSGIKKCKMMKTPQNDKVNEALFLWFTQCRSKGLPVSGPILQQKALQFNRDMGNESDFKASEGWLGKWKNRYGIRKLQISGEKLSANEESVESVFNEPSKLPLHLFLTKTDDADENGNGQPLPEITIPNIDVKNEEDNTQILISRCQSPILEKSIAQLTPHETIIIKEELDLDEDYNSNSSEHSRDDIHVEFENMLYKMEETNPLEENQYFSGNSKSLDFREVTTHQRSSELVKPIQENYISDFGDINPTQPKKQTSRTGSNKDPTFSDLKSKCVNPEQKLRIDYLKIMIKKEKIEMENNREVHLQRMENLKLEHELLKLELENKKKVKFVSQHFW